MFLYFIESCQPIVGIQIGHFKHKQAGLVQSNILFIFTQFYQWIQNILKRLRERLSNKYRNQLLGSLLQWYAAD